MPSSSALWKDLNSDQCVSHTSADHFLSVSSSEAVVWLQVEGAGFLILKCTELLGQFEASQAMF